MSLLPIKHPIRNGELPDWGDLNRTRQVFRDLGLYKSDQNGPMLDGDLVDAIKVFQKTHDLVVDGIMNPGGETEREIFKIKTGKPHPNFERIKLAQLENSDDKIGFGRSVRGVDSKRDPHHPDFGLIVDKPKTEKQIPMPTPKPDYKSDRNLFDIQPPTNRPVDKNKMYEILRFDPNKGGGDFRSFVQFGMKPDEIARKAEKEAQKIFSKSRGFEDESDAFRHALGSYLMAKEIGPENAKKVLDRHERFPMSGLSPRDTEMGMLQDLYNNNVGIEAAIDPKNKNRDPVEVIHELYKSGRLQTRPFNLK